MLSEFEREMIVERTHAGLSAVRVRGCWGGRPKKSDADIERGIKLYKSKEIQHSSNQQDDQRW